MEAKVSVVQIAGVGFTPYVAAIATLTTSSTKAAPSAISPLPSQCLA
jgi:hypothetical protein